jgi:hypothetical protein
VNGASRKHGVMAIVAGIVVMLVGGLEAGPVYARREGDRRSPAGHTRQDEELYGCDRTFGRPPEGHLAKHTDPAGDRPVQPGDTIAVSITWRPGDWSSDELHKVLDCVAVDGRLVRSLQGGESPTANDGRFARSYGVPPDVPDGARICDQAMLSGPSPRGDYDRQISNQVCHTVSGGATCCRGGNGCGECRRQAPCGEDCGHHPPCDDQPCGEKSCGDRACDDHAPRCGGGCGEPAPCGDDGCGRTPPCGGGSGDTEPSCGRDGTPPHGRGGHDRDCGCDRDGDRHRGRLSELLHDLL